MLLKYGYNKINKKKCKKKELVHLGLSGNNLNNLNKLECRNRNKWANEEFGRMCSWFTLEVSTLAMRRPWPAKPLFLSASRSSIWPNQTITKCVINKACKGCEFRLPDVLQQRQRLKKAATGAQFENRYGCIWALHYDAQVTSALDYLKLRVTNFRGRK